MKFGVDLMGVRLRHQGRIARHAETLGFDSVWLPEHLVFPDTLPPQYPYSGNGAPPVESSAPLYDVFVQLANIAGRTEHISLGTCVYILPLRHPIVTARSVVTLDRVSGGRVLFGVGVGWLEEEFSIVGLDPRDRGQATDEIIPLLRRLWTEPVVEHTSARFPLPPIRFEPKPIAKPHPPILVGGASPAALRRAGTLADGYIDIGTDSIDEIARKLEVIDGHRRTAGRADAPFDVTVNDDIAPDADAIARCAELGVTRVVVHPAQQGSNDPSALEDWLSAYAASAGVDASPPA